MKDLSCAAKVIVVAAMAGTLLACDQAKEPPAQAIDWSVAPPGVTAGRNLSPAMRPKVEIDYFKGLDCISVSEYDSQHQGAYIPNRVFRFTYQSRFEDEKELWKLEFPADDGWIIETDNDEVFMIARRYADGPVSEHAMILQSGRFVRDEESYSKTAGYRDINYVRVSLNEMVRPEQKEPIKKITVYSDDYNKSMDIDVPDGLALVDWRVSEEGTIKVSFDRAIATDRSAHRMLEIWLVKGDQELVSVLNIGDTDFELPGIGQLKAGHSMLLSKEEIVEEKEIVRYGTDVSITLPQGGEWKPCLIVSRWAPIKVEGAFMTPNVYNIRVSSIEITPELLSIIHPTVDYFSLPMIEHYVNEGY